MAKANFYLDKADSENRRAIFLYFSFNGKRVKLFTNESILEKDWNPETMRARKSRDGSVELNLILDKMQSDVERIYREMLLEGISPTAQRFKERLNIEVKYKSVKDFWSSFEIYLHECEAPEYSGYKSKSFHLDHYCFDSKPESKLFWTLLQDKKVDKVWFTGMLTHGQFDFAITYVDPFSNTVRSYYPDFLVKLNDGTYVILEVKGDNMIDDEIVKAKAHYANQIASASKMSYKMIKGTEAMGGMGL